MVRYPFVPLGENAMITILQQRNILRLFLVIML